MGLFGRNVKSPYPRMIFAVKSLFTASHKVVFDATSVKYESAARTGENANNDAINAVKMINAVNFFIKIPFPVCIMRENIP